MMRIAIKDLKELAKKRDLRMGIVFATDDKLQHIATYGDSLKDCDRAALYGDYLKKLLKLPESMLKQEPARVKKLKEENKQLRKQISLLESHIISCHEDSSELRKIIMQKVSE